MNYLESLIFYVRWNFLGWLYLTDFDAVRAVRKPTHVLMQNYERRALRRSVELLSVAGRVTVIELHDICQSGNWSYLFNVAGWLAAGGVGRSLRSLQRRLEDMHSIWEVALSVRETEEEETA